MFEFVVFVFLLVNGQPDPNQIAGHFTFKDQFTSKQACIENAESELGKKELAAAYTAAKEMMGNTPFKIGYSCLPLPGIPA